MRMDEYDTRKLVSAPAQISTLPDIIRENKLVEFYVLRTNKWANIAQNVFEWTTRVVARRLSIAVTKLTAGTGSVFERDLFVIDGKTAHCIASIGIDRRGWLIIGDENEVMKIWELAMKT